LFRKYKFEHMRLG